MGYTHYWYRTKEIPKEKFKAIVSDFKKVAEAIERAGIKLRGGNGTGEPEINHEIVCFNGDALCGHPRREVGIAWPSEEAGGIILTTKVDPREGTWSFGCILQARTCDGDCSHETFYFPRVVEGGFTVGKVAYIDGDTGRPVYNDPKIVGKYFSCCKTAFKPYDIAVNAFLIIAKHHLGDEIIVRSDGEIQHWYDAMHICQDILGYGEEFELDEEDE